MHVQCTCRQCGATFTTKHGRRNRPLPSHCSRACAGLSRRLTVDRVCEHCATSFGVRPSELIWRAARFCSAACADAAHERTWIHRTCETCGLVFPMYPSNLRREGNGRFCSIACRHETPSTLFWRHAVRGQYPDSCWTWLGATDGKGYGRLWDKRLRHSTPAARVSWQIHIGPIPRGLYACHRCDNPPCTNPEHLFLGTQTENMRDMVRKGRGRWPRTKRDAVIQAE